MTIPGVPASTTGCTIPASHGAVADQGTCQPEPSENRTETHVSRYLVARDPCLCVCVCGRHVVVSQVKRDNQKSSKKFHAEIHANFSATIHPEEIGYDLPFGMRGR